jgi:hypothetical protein
MQLDEMTPEGNPQTIPGMKSYLGSLDEYLSRLAS